jgi:3-methyladenine DNA glycosylase/8-oxoguanine DNA glycosylase
MSTTLAGSLVPWGSEARQALIHADRVLGRHIERIGACRLQPQPSSSIVAALAEAIVYQQLTAKAAATIHARVAALGAAGFPSAAELLALPETNLRGAGLSASKARALKDLAEKELDGRLPSLAECAALPDDEVVARLTVVRGIGPWTVQMLLMFKLGRPDVLPATDYGVQKGFQRVFRTRDLPRPRAVLARGERWRPWRTAAAWYLWRALDPPLSTEPKTETPTSSTPTLTKPRARTKSTARAGPRDVVTSNGASPAGQRRLRRLTTPP